MATKPSSSPGLLKLEEQLTCPVCLEHYTNPKTLPCLHSFCQDCLERFPLDGSKSFYCPICRVSVALPEEGARAFPVAFHLNNLKEMYSLMNNQQDCDNPRMTSFDELESTTAPDPLNCSTHDEPLKYYCYTCNGSICFCCAIFAHKSHNICSQEPEEGKLLIMILVTHYKSLIGMFKSDIAQRVMTECTPFIKDCGIDLLPLVDKLLEHKIKNSRERKKIIYVYATQSIDERMDEMLSIILSSIRIDGDVFGVFTDILKEEGTDSVADDLLKEYRKFDEYYDDAELDDGKFKHALSTFHKTTTSSILLVLQGPMLCVGEY